LIVDDVVDAAVAELRHQLATLDAATGAPPMSSPR
jgi:hypothetical protein